MFNFELMQEKVNTVKDAVETNSFYTGSDAHTAETELLGFYAKIKASQYLDAIDTIIYQSNVDNNYHSDNLKLVLDVLKREF
jgi:hypothetical protein